jgi:hypothetical protein
MPAKTRTIEGTPKPASLFLWLSVPSVTIPVPDAELTNPNLQACLDLKAERQADDRNPPYDDDRGLCFERGFRRIAPTGAEKWRNAVTLRSKRESLVTVVHAAQRLSP